MAHLTYEQSKSKAYRVISILAVITIFEVMFALVGKGHIGSMHFHPVLMGGVMIILSFVKAYLIIYEFMHMKYEVPGLVKTVLLPMLLLVWAIIAFMYEGDSFRNSRNKVLNGYDNVMAPDEVGSLSDNETYFIG